METLKITIDKTFDFVSEDSIKGFKNNLEKYNAALDDKSGKGNDFLGWVNLPSSISESELKEIEDVAAYFKKETEVVVVVNGSSACFTFFSSNKYNSICTT